MVTLRFRKETVDFTVDVSRLARDHPPLERVRRALIDEHKDVALVDQYLSHRLAAAFGKFGHDYIGEMTARIDRIFEIRNELANSVDAALRGETVHIDSLRTKFADLDRELDQLKSPTKTAEQATTLAAPRDPPSQTTPEPAQPAKGGAAGGGARPPDHLTAVAHTEAVHAGLRVVDSATAPPGLRSQLAAIAERNPELAQNLLRGIGKFLTSDHREELHGINNYLERRGSPNTLARLLSATEHFGGATPDWAGDIRAAFRMMRHFDEEAVRGVGVVFGSGYTAKGALNIFHNCQSAPALASGIFASLANLDGVTGLNKIIGFLGGPPENFKAVQGQLLTANQLKQRYPDAVLVFEERGTGRVPDIQVWGAAGGTPINVEVKFYTTFDSIGTDAGEQFAVDLVQEAQRRRDFPRRDGSVEPPYSAMLWRFERGNLATELSATLGRKVTDAELAAEIKRRLKRAFDRHEAMLRTQLGPEFDVYKAAFDNASFLELY